MAWNAQRRPVHTFNIAAVEEAKSQPQQRQSRYSSMGCHREERKCNKYSGTVDAPICNTFMLFDSRFHYFCMHRCFFVVAYVPLPCGLIYIQDREYTADDAIKISW